jgi:hypothetical protein
VYIYDNIFRRPRRRVYSCFVVDEQLGREEKGAVEPRSYCMNRFPSTANMYTRVLRYIRTACLRELIDKLTPCWHRNGVPTRLPMPPPATSGWAGCVLWVDRDERRVSSSAWVDRVHPAQPIQQLTLTNRDICNFASRSTSRAAVVIRPHSWEMPSGFVHTHGVQVRVCVQ